MNDILIFSKWLNDLGYSTTPINKAIVIHYGNSINLATLYEASEFNCPYLFSSLSNRLNLNFADQDVFNKIEQFLLEQIKRRTECWNFPLGWCTGIPLGKAYCFDLAHPGSYGYRRKGYWHTGIDLYTKEFEPVLAVEAGKVVRKGSFTGEQDGTPWWLNTDYIMVEGNSGVVLYGEIELPSLTVGDKVAAGNIVGRVKRVVKPGNDRFDISGWRPSMLHFELYKHGCYEPAETINDNLIDPTEKIINCVNIHSLDYYMLTDYHSM